ncbi:MAG: sulfotransferase family protein [Alphaproteobacteria bacterium]|nr:sulfotransferase family protein [Alphaproteobacteria bacterium]
MTTGLHVMLHIPKCAGTTMEGHLTRHLGKRRVWTPKKRTRRFPLELFGRKYDPRPPGPLDDIVAVSGHFIGRSIERHFPNRRIKRSIILRDPERLMMSYYNYRMMRYISQGQRPFPFIFHMRALPPNPVATFLLERWLEMPLIRVVALDRAKKAALLDDALCTFDHVVDISQADDLTSWCSRDLGIPETADRSNTAETWERHTGWKSVRLEDLADAERDELRERVALDHYLWRRWALGEIGVLAPRVRTLEISSQLARPGYQIRRRLARSLA